MFCQLYDYAGEFFGCRQLSAVSAIHVFGDPLLPRPLQHHVLNVIRYGLVLESPDIGTTAFEGLRVPGRRGARTLE